jgi:cbb3-type cytochrome oxidase subunit 3
VKEVLADIAGIGVYPTVALCLFALVFAGVVWRAWRLGRRDVDRLSALPLDDDSPARTGTGEPS